MFYSDNSIKCLNIYSVKLICLDDNRKIPSLDFCQASNWKDAGGYSREKENAEGNAYILAQNNCGMWRQEEKGIQGVQKPNHDYWIHFQHEKGFS